jgi:hypothetical protein
MSDNTIRTVYLAARYSRHGEMRQVRDKLRPLGYEVTSRWIDMHGGNLTESLVPEKLNAEPEACWPYAKIDLDDIWAADVVISFTSADGGGKGGRHVEFGFALGLGKHLVIVGPFEHVFHTLPLVEWYPDLDQLLSAWSSTQTRKASTMQFTFTVNVTAERTEGKFASRDDIAEQIMSEIESADPGTVDGENGGIYEITEWEVSDNSLGPAKVKA